ncbi:MAG TPA: hypothetical protein VMN78_08300 [Longimicrobiales bacterium]|nr:hypothetical protein [Longimicrobiales bacterium]
MSNRLLALVFCAPLVVACGEDPAGATGDPVDCGPEVTEVDVDVSITTNSVFFDWSPRCRVAMLIVEEGAGDVWAIGNEDSNSIEPPVTYGVAPAGVEEYGPEPLVAGRAYEVILWMTSAEGDRLLAVHPFTRPSSDSY